MAENSIKFLPYIKRQPPLPIEESQPGHLTATLELKIIDGNDEPHPVGKQDLILRGPGDILGISPKMIARVEPQPNTHDFEPNYFPFIEFVDPDLPWRYSLDRINAPGTTQLPKRVYPWLALIVLSNAEINDMADEDIDVISLLEDRREFLSVKGRFLPNLNHAWATAHVHLNQLDRAINQFIEERLASHCSRLFCCRKLEAETQYTAFLIPTYKIAVQAAFGLEAEDLGKEKAWDNPAAEDIIKLPIYYRWSFSTSESGDFESLARKLVPAALDSNRVGFRAVDANLMTPAAESDLDLFFLREGALAAPAFSQNRQSYAKGSQSLPLTKPMLKSLNESLKTSAEPLADDDTDDIDPLVTLPVYGRYFRKTTAIQPPDKDRWPDPTPWVHELNLDFRNRVAAAFGTKVVQKNQEEYVKECWLQAGKIREANEQLRRTQAGYQIAKALEKKHLAPLSDERFALISTPFHGHFALSEQGTGSSLKQTLAKSGISRGVFSSTFRRVAHQRININQTKPFNAIAAAKTSAYLRPRRSIQQNIPTMTPRVNEFFANLPVTNVEVLAPKQEVIPVEEIDTGQEFRSKFNIKQVLTQKIKGVIKLGGDRSISENFDPIMAAPKIERSMYRHLADLSADYMLPGIENLVNNGVTLCEENRRFIEAYMVGLNHEMGRELVWRHYPTDRRGTIFAYFWDPIKAHTPPSDIQEIHKWLANLGSNKSQAAKGANLVLVIKGDLIRRYPGTIIYALKITTPGKAGRPWEYWSEGYPDSNPPMDETHRLEPVFRAQVGSDILFVGFPFSLENVQGNTRNGEYYFILQENQDLPRFGLDIASQRMPPEGGCGTEGIDINENEFSWSDVCQDNAGYINDFSIFGDTSAAVATKTYQLPIRVAIHASELLSNGGTP